MARAGGDPGMVSLFTSSEGNQNLLRYHKKSFSFVSVLEPRGNDASSTTRPASGRDELLLMLLSVSRNPDARGPPPARPRPHTCTRERTPIRRNNVS